MFISLQRNSESRAPLYGSKRLPRSGANSAHSLSSTSKFYGYFIGLKAAVGQSFEVLAEASEAFSGFLVTSVLPCLANRTEQTEGLTGG